MNISPESTVAGAVIATKAPVLLNGMIHPTDQALVSNGIDHTEDQSSSVYKNGPVGTPSKPSSPVEGDSGVPSDRSRKRLASPSSLVETSDPSEAKRPRSGSTDENLLSNGSKEDTHSASAAVKDTEDKSTLKDNDTNTNDSISATNDSGSISKNVPDDSPKNVSSDSFTPVVDSKVKERDVSSVDSISSPNETSVAGSTAVPKDKDAQKDGVEKEKDGGGSRKDVPIETKTQEKESIPETASSSVDDSSSSSESKSSLLEKQKGEKAESNNEEKVVEKNEEVGKCSSNHSCAQEKSGDNVPEAESCPANNEADVTMEAETSIAHVPESKKDENASEKTVTAMETESESVSPADDKNADDEEALATSLKDLQVSKDSCAVEEGQSEAKKPVDEAEVEAASSRGTSFLNRSVSKDFGASFRRVRESADRHDGQIRHWIRANEDMAKQVSDLKKVLQHQKKDIEESRKHKHPYKAPLKVIRAVGLQITQSTVENFLSKVDEPDVMGAIPGTAGSALIVAPRPRQTPAQPSTASAPPPPLSAPPPTTSSSSSSSSPSRPPLRSKPPTDQGASKPNPNSNEPRRISIANLLHRNPPATKAPAAVPTPPSPIILTSLAPPFANLPATIRPTRSEASPARTRSSPTPSPRPPPATTTNTSSSSVDLIDLADDDDDGAASSTRRHSNRQQPRTPSFVNTSPRRNIAPLPPRPSSNPAQGAIPPTPTLEAEEVNHPPRSVKLKWNIPTVGPGYEKNVKSYEVVSHKKGDMTWNNVGEIESLQLPMVCTISDLNIGVHYFAIRAITRSGVYSEFSTIASISVSDKPRQIQRQNSASSHTRPSPSRHAEQPITIS